MGQLRFRRKHGPLVGEYGNILGKFTYEGREAHDPDCANQNL